MTPETRDAIGKAVYDASPLKQTPTWDKLTEQMKERWRIMAQAAVDVFLERAHWRPPDEEKADVVVAAQTTSGVVRRDGDL